MSVLKLPRRDNNNPQAATLRCTTFIDESTYESNPLYQSGALMKKYALGQGERFSSHSV
jgi:hypothetical protein